MSEPGTTVAGGLALYKIGAIGFLFAVFAAIVVMAMTMPRTVREFVVAMICTVMSSIGGGAFVIRFLEISHWAVDDIGLVALGGVVFVCGLPAWILVRAFFAWSEGKTLPQMIREFRAARDQTGL